MIDLPKPIADYVDANARLDAGGMLKSFATDAVVKDEGGTHQGHAEILTWLKSATIASEAIFTPDTVRDEEGRCVVSGLTSGNFKGSPLRFTFQFTIENDLITALEISL
ncbi:nuclear transport factor 2 family protein [Asticcacaulis sp. SL142]|uniref:nuclear transport factor 2 family protein n=1 Tax=Asticcacaulis sp. SL142 TaxID=2995155 RepID=UPI00226D1932|nr:nuclear transport factor 2 family protein [Asticcacaulis sp. SL142]WAC48290.1 nuclear transport factor 2 family protein [Asticcacaulis sp. SL142]